MTGGIIRVFDMKVGMVEMIIADFLEEDRLAIIYPKNAPMKVAREPTITSRGAHPSRRFARKQPRVIPGTAYGVNAHRTQSASGRRSCTA